MNFAATHLADFRFAVCLPLLATSACATVTGFPKSSQNDSVEIAADQPYFAGDVRTREDSPADADRSGRTRRQYRDAVVFSRINAIDIRYRQFEAALTGTQTGFSTVADLAVLALNGVAATTGGAATKAALAAASGGVVGAKSTINTDLFYKNTMPALVTQMRANRATALLVIKRGLENPVDSYTLDEALNDIQSYYAAGTLPSAVQQVTAQAGAQLTKANDELTVVHDPSFLTNQVPAVALSDRVNALTPTQALAVAAALKPKLTERSSFVQQALANQFPGIDAITDGATAKKLLAVWIVLDDRSAALQQEWTDALAAATN